MKEHIRMGGSAVYGLGVIGAAVYFISHAPTFWLSFRISQGLGLARAPGLLRFGGFSQIALGLRESFSRLTKSQN